MSDSWLFKLVMAVVGFGALASIAKSVSDIYIAHKSRWDRVKEARRELYEAAILNIEKAESAFARLDPSYQELAAAVNFLLSKRVSFSEEVARAYERVLSELRKLAEDYHAVMEKQFGPDWPSHLTDAVRTQLVEVATEVGVKARLVEVKKEKERLISRMRRELQ